jgi:biopolymer transport protein ExbD
VFAEKQSQRRVTLDMSPMMDIVFLLLIFFLVTSTFLPDSGMDLELPESTTATQSELAPTMISVAEDGALRLDGEAISVEELQQRVAALPQSDRQRITVRADARVDYGVIVRIIDALRNAGVNGLSLPMDAVQEGQGSGR